MIKAVLNVPISNKGLLLDQSIPNQVESIMTSGTPITDVFILSYGWWTDDESGQILYNKWSTNLVSKQSDNKIILQLNIFWPSILSQDSNSLANILEPFTFYSDKKASDQVGIDGLAQILTLIDNLNDLYKQKVTYTGIGHSFGCRVICSGISGIVNESKINLILLQAAINTNGFDANGEYPNINNKLNNNWPIRILATRSGLDTALVSLWLDAMKLEYGKNAESAIGAVGIDNNILMYLTQTNLDIDLGFVPPVLCLNNLVIANLTSLQSYDGIEKPDLEGSHADIDHVEIYNTINSFLL